MMRRLNIFFPYILFSLIIALLVWSNFSQTTTSEMSTASSIDTMAALDSNREVEPRESADPTICQHCGNKIKDTVQAQQKQSKTTFRFCSLDCRTAYLDARFKRLAQTKGQTIDPVCHMEVNPSWGHGYEFEGTTFHFCTDICRKAFKADPLAYIAERCMVCTKPVIPSMSMPATYLGSTYYLCSDEHQQKFKADPASYFMHRMWGIPNWLYFVSIALVLIVSFAMFEGLAYWQRKQGIKPAADRPGERLPLKWVGRFFGKRPVRFCFQLFMATAFILIIIVGLIGNQNPALNLVPLLTWTIWWCGLVVLIMFVGKAWCYMCPWDAISSWMVKLRFWKKTDETLGLGLPWPKAFRNIAIATFLFVTLTWLEIGFNATMRPSFTAWLAIGMLTLAVVSAFLFDRKSFCRYGCLVGRVSGLYAMFSGVEVRAKNAETCRSCRGKECYNGSADAYGCPTFEHPSIMKTNTYCTQCTECIQACPYDNIDVNMRPWGEDLKVEIKPRADEAYLALLMLAITGFHGLTMTPAWGELTAFLNQQVNMGRMGSFTVGMLMMMGLPIVIYAVLIFFSRIIAITVDPELKARFSYREYFVKYAYCMLPIALFYHLAHNLEHLLMEGPKIIARLSDPLGWGWNLFGTAGISIPPLASLETLWIFQVLLVGVGHVYSLWAAQKTGQHIFTNQKAASRGQWPMLIGMIAFSIFSLWLLKQPMEMRTSAM